MSLLATSGNVRLSASSSILQWWFLLYSGSDASVPSISLFEVSSCEKSFCYKWCVCDPTIPPQWKDPGASQHRLYEAHNCGGYFPKPIFFLLPMTLQFFILKSGTVEFPAPCCRRHRRCKGQTQCLCIDLFSTCECVVNSNYLIVHLDTNNFNYNIPTSF